MSEFQKIKTLAARQRIREMWRPVGFRRTVLLTLGSAVSCFSLAAQANLDSTSSLSQIPIGEVAAPPPVSSTQSSSGFSGTLGLETAGYLYSPRTKAEEVYPTLIGRSQGHVEKGWFELGGQGEGIVMAPLSKKDKPAAYFELPEAYVSTSSSASSTVKVSLGRKLEEWNHLDEQWKLGIWQPRYRWDYLRPDSVALTGVTFEVDQPLFHAVLFGSYIYVPERGVPIGTQDGQLISDSPWFISPPSRLSVLSQNTPLKYDLQIPPAREVIFHQSFSAMFRVGDQQGPWFSAGAAYKPMNQLLLAFDGDLVINANPSAQDVAEVPIVPRVVYHKVGSVEGGFRNEFLSAWLSTLFDRPDRDATIIEDGGRWTYQQVSNSVAVSPSLEFRVKDARENRIKATMSYLFQEGGNADAKAAEGAGMPAPSNVFEQRYPFHRAVMLGGELEMPALARSLGIHSGGPVLLASSFLYDLQNRGSILSVDAKYRPTSSWEAGLGVDVLGSEDVQPGSKTGPNDFIGRYRANDRIRAGVTYAF